MTQHTEYVVGFLFSINGEYVALITKNRPDWQRHLKNGIGGHVEKGEASMEAMHREFREETGVSGLNWEHKISLTGGNYLVEFYCAFSDEVYKVKTLTDEPVSVEEVGCISGTVPNLKWLIPIMLDKDLQSATVQTKHSDTPESHINHTEGT